VKDCSATSYPLMKKINRSLVLVSALACTVLAAANANALILIKLARLGTAAPSIDPGWGGPTIQAINGKYGDYTVKLMLSSIPELRSRAANFGNRVGFLTISFTRRS
jgi:hypothetical protein